MWKVAGLLASLWGHFYHALAAMVALEKLLAATTETQLYILTLC